MHFHSFPGADYPCQSCPMLWTVDTGLHPGAVKGQCYPLDLCAATRSQDPLRNKKAVTASPLHHTPYLTPIIVKEMHPHIIQLLKYMAHMHNNIFTICWLFIVYVDISHLTCF